MDRDSMDRGGMDRGREGVLQDARLGPLHETIDPSSNRLLPAIGLPAIGADLDVPDGSRPQCHLAKAVATAAAQAAAKHLTPHLSHSAAWMFRPVRWM
jgi:hypothetical protein